MMKTIKNKSSDKQLHKINNFSKEFFPLKENLDREDLSFCQSSRNLNYLLKMQEKVLGKPKEISQTILYEKIKRHSSKKGLDAPIIKTIAGHKELLSLSNITKSINKKEDINSNKENYLQVNKIQKISDEDFEKIRAEIARSENLEQLYKETMDLESFPLNDIDYHSNIGCLLSLEALIQSKYNDNPLCIEEMEDKYNLYKDFIYNYRFIKGDGNCFYRAVVFRYFEIIMLNKIIDLLKNIINDMKESFKSNEIRSRMRIKYDTYLDVNLILSFMIIILELIENNRIADAHHFYVKSINLYPTFDYGLIIYFRYIFYNYIKKNENKLYLKSFPIKIGNLLPSKYETIKGEFLFNKFYYCYLLSMFTDAEKIIIYLTPFVLGINLDIIAFDDNQNEVIKNINYEGESEYDFNNDKIFVLNIAGHYELLYSENDNKKYKNIFEKFICNSYINENVIIKEDKNINELSKSTNINKNELTNKLTNNKKENENEKIDDNNHNNNNNNNNNNFTEKPNYKNNMLYSSSSPTKTTSFFNSRTEAKNNYMKNIKKDSKNNISNTNSVKAKIILNKKQEDNNNINPKYKYYYSNICKNNEYDNLEVKRFNNTEKKQMKNLGVIYENSSRTDDKTLKSKNQNKNILNSNNIYSSIKKNNETKKTVEIKSMNLSNVLNKDNSERQKKLTKSSHNINDKLSKALISPKKNEKKIENRKSKNYINDNNKCQICSIEYDLNNQKEQISNICYECLKNEILNQIYPNYISYIQETMINSFDKAFKSNFTNFLKNKINVLEQYISIEYSIKDLYIKNKENSTEAKEIESIFREIKSRFCIYCSKEIKIENFIIPCGCNFCCLDHIKKYFHLKNNIKNISNYVCMCSYDYSNIDIYNLGLFFSKNRLFSLKMDVIDLLNNNLSKQCCFCSISLDIDIIRRIKYKDLEENKKNNLILADCTQLKHYICNICSQVYCFQTETFFCTLCNKNHIYIPNLS